MDYRATLLLGVLLLAGCESETAGMIRYCEERGIPYRIGGDAPAPEFETRSQRAERITELADKLHPTKAETRELIQLSLAP